MSFFTRLFGLPEDYFSNPGDYTPSYEEAVENQNEEMPSFGSALTSSFSEAAQNIGSAVSGVNRPSDVIDASGMLGDSFEYINDLLQTDQEAALRQAVANEEAAVSSWKRSEQSAENALNRSRQLRQTYYQDLLKSLESAGLNPVLAAAGGFGGVSSSAPQGTSQASSSSKADGLNAANLLQAIAAIISGAGSLLGNLNPLKAVQNINSKGEVSLSSYSYGKR